MLSRRSRQQDVDAMSDPNPLIIRAQWISLVRAILRGEFFARHPLTQSILLFDLLGDFVSMVGQSVKIAQSQLTQSSWKLTRK